MAKQIIDDTVMENIEILAKLALTLSLIHI